MTNLIGTEQEKDLHEPANCKGYGRIRHFRRATSAGWPANPLPIDPASTRLGLAPSDMMRSQVFQNASCNWRCWYCFVPFSLLSANPKHSSWLSAADLVEMYLAEPDRPAVIDLSGGQPDLTPEWVPWMMDELSRRGLDQSTYLWSDDNLSNDYFWQFLTPRQILQVRNYRNYGKVCCFKGFDSVSFSFNTKAEPKLFDRQFELFRRYVELGIDAYAYATFTTPERKGIKRAMTTFVDRLQGIAEQLPLRVVPLEISMFRPMEDRVKEQHQTAIQTQNFAIACWNNELQCRFSEGDRNKPIYEVPLEPR